MIVAKQSMRLKNVSKELQLPVPDNIDGSNILEIGRCRQYNAFTHIAKRKYVPGGSSIVDKGCCRQKFASTRVSNIRRPGAISGSTVIW